MRKNLLFCIYLMVAAYVFSQTSVAESKLAKTLEKNKDENAVFVSEIDLSKMDIDNDGTLKIPLFTKSKLSIICGIDFTNLKERIEFTKKSVLSVSFKLKPQNPKTYEVINIDGIESLDEYNARIAEEERIRWKKERLENLTKMPVQVVNLEVINITGTEVSWLPGQIQDKLKSNLQEFLSMKTVVDSKSEAALKKLQAESESDARDESTAIELGKITTAKFALFTKIRKTGNGYIISIDFTDLTTGEQMASATSKEYSKSEYLYGSTGAVDELTLALCNKLELPISDLNKNLLSTGSASFSVDEQLALAKQNEEQFNKMMSQYDADIAKLNVSNDISAIENKKKIEAEKALLIEKQNAEKKRMEELNAQKLRAEEDAKLEAERSIALKTQRDEMAKQAAARAAEVRKVKLNKQGILGQINVIESKKKALVEIRQSVEARCAELYDSLKKEYKDEEQKIRNREFSSVELESGQPTQAAKRRRENQIWANYEKYAKKYFDACNSVTQAAISQDAALIKEIRLDQKALTSIRTVNNMGEELKISYGSYSGVNNGWRVYMSLYSDGFLLFQDRFILNYEALTGKKSVNLGTETNEKLIEEYIENVDMYNSLLSRGNPIVYFEIDYSVNPENDDKPSEYEFNFDKIRVINTISGKIVQTSNLGKKITHQNKPVYDLRDIKGIVFECKNIFEKKLFKRNRLKDLQNLGFDDKQIYDVSTEWINSMNENIFKEFKETIANNFNEIDSIFVKTYAEISRKYENNKKINYVIIINGSTTIGYRAFYGCTSLKYIFIPDSLTSIDKEAFFGCSKLTSVTIPQSVTSIESNAFFNCPLKVINYYGTKDDWENINISGKQFENVKINYNYKEN